MMPGCYGRSFTILEVRFVDVYTATYYNQQRDFSRQSAEAVVPLLMDLTAPHSVIDVGCGVGTWLATFSYHGVSTILGVDGDYVPREMLEFPKEAFQAANLSQPLDTGRVFDLAVSLEVGEHLPASSAHDFVASLVAAAPVIAFSAAIPEQGGDEHVNEQWPEYWAELFDAHDYVVIDVIRPLIWQRADIAAHYRQNILLFCHRERLAHYPRLLEASQITRPHMLSIVHPEIYIRVNPSGNEFTELSNWTRHQEEAIRWYQSRDADHERRLSELHTWADHQQEVITEQTAEIARLNAAWEELHQWADHQQEVITTQAAEIAHLKTS